MMFSGVVDRLREFGTLKAIGATSGDLTLLLLIQAACYALIGSALGLTAIGLLARALCRAQLSISLPPAAVAGSIVLMLLICGLASRLALLRLRKVDPAIIFRG